MNQRDEAHVLSLYYEKRVIFAWILPKHLDYEIT